MDLPEPGTHAFDAEHDRPEGSPRGWHHIEADEPAQPGTREPVTSAESQHYIETGEKPTGPLVYVLYAEYQEGDLAVVVSVHASQDGAKEAEAVAVKDAKDELHQQVYGEEDEGEDEGDWDVCFHIEAFAVKP